MMNLLLFLLRMSKLYYEILKDSKKLELGMMREWFIAKSLQVNIGTSIISTTAKPLI